MKKFKQALVCGLGGSGSAAVSLLRAEGCAVTAIDRADTPDLRRQSDELRQQGATVLLGAVAVPESPFDICVVSPGVPDSSPWIVSMRSRGRGVPVMSELELGWSRRGRSRVVAITGSNGKSTAVKWFAESLQAAGLKALPCGNYGPAISKVVMESPGADWLVVEASTFQMETIIGFRPDVGILLNIFPNHLDRHATLKRYTELKARLFSNTLEDDTCVVLEPLLAEIRALSGGRGRWISFGSSVTSEYRYEAGHVLHDHRMVADLAGTRFANEVLGLAAAAVVAGIEVCGVAADCAVRSARAFVPLPHRMELIREIGSVKYVNDSKATNLTAMAAALRMTPGKTRLIAGGLVKEKDFNFMKELLAQRVLGVYLIGKATEEMALAWSDVVSCFPCGDLETAVRKAGHDARAGETVLLSPACASFDQYRNFEERGQHFVRVVQNLAEEASQWKRKTI